MLVSILSSIIVFLVTKRTFVIIVDLGIKRCDVKNQQFSNKMTLFRWILLLKPNEEKRDRDQV